MYKIDQPSFMTERELVAYIRSTLAGGGEISPAYWEALYAKSRPWICRSLARRGVQPRDVEDGFHDVYMRLFINIAKIRESLAFRNYVLQIIRDVARSHRRRQAPEVEIDEDTFEMSEPAHQTADLDFVKVTLTGPQYEVVGLIYSNGCSREEAAKCMGVTLRQVRRIREEAITKLKALTAIRQSAA